MTTLAYNVDLFLFKHEGLFFNKIPKQVNVLEEPPEYQYFDMPIKAAIIDAMQQGRLDITFKGYVQVSFLKVKKTRPVVNREYGGISQNP